MVGIAWQLNCAALAHLVCVLHHRAACALLRQAATTSSPCAPAAASPLGARLVEDAPGCSTAPAPRGSADSSANCEVNETSVAPLLQAARLWHAQLSPWVLQRLRLGLQRLADFSATLSVGSMFSGTDVSEKVIFKLHQIWESLLCADDCPRMVQFVFQCEIDPAKQEWLKEQFPNCKFLFGDASALSKAKAFDIKSGSYVQVPYVDVLLAGFSCKSRGKLNCNSASNKNCVREGREETGLTFQYVQNFIAFKRPRLVVLENVVELQEGGLDSDLQYIVDTFEKINYKGCAIEMEARDYGSFSQRKRLYFVFFLGADVSRVDVARSAIEVPCNPCPMAHAFSS